MGVEGIEPTRCQSHEIYSLAELLSRLHPHKYIKLDSYPLEDDASGALITPQVVYYLYKLPKITSNFIVLLSNAKLFRYEVLRIYLFIAIHPK